MEQNTAFTQTLLNTLLDWLKRENSQAMNSIGTKFYVFGVPAGLVEMVAGNGTGGRGTFGWGFSSYCTFNCESGLGLWVTCRYT